MNAFWRGFEKRALDGLDSVAEFDSEKAKSDMRKADRQAANCSSGARLDEFTRIKEAGLGEMIGVSPLRRGFAGVSKLMHDGSLVREGSKMRIARHAIPAYEQAGAELNKGVRRMGGTALAAGATYWGGKKMLSGHGNPVEEHGETPV